MPFYKYTRCFLTGMKVQWCGGGRGLLLGENASAMLQLLLSRHLCLLAALWWCFSVYVHCVCMLCKYTWLFVWVGTGVSYLSADHNFRSKCRDGLKRYLSIQLKRESPTPVVTVRCLVPLFVFNNLQFKYWSVARSSRLKFLCISEGPPVKCRIKLLFSIWGVLKLWF